MTEILTLWDRRRIGRERSVGEEGSGEEGKRKHLGWLVQSCA